MDLEISGKKAIVCASSEGLGYGCAQALAEAGCDVIINGRRADRAENVARQLSKSTGARVIAVIGDIGTKAGRKKILLACPNPDILVTNNGGPDTTDFNKITEKEIIDACRQNFVAPFELIQSVLMGMCERRFGRIVNITSLSVYMPMSGLALSSGARSGLTAILAEAVGACASHNVTINNLLPGKMETARIRNIIQNVATASKVSINETTDQVLSSIPARRFGNAAEFGKLCAFLCSAHAGYITGQNLVVDGGLHRRIF